jgi:pilus assembly protein CpaE
MAAAALQPKTAVRTHAGHVVTVYSPKGGAGATTVATNLAVGLARRGGHVCLVDTDLQYGDVGIFLNLRLPNSVADLTESRDGLDPEAVDMVLGDHSSGARILLAPRSPELAETVVPENLGELLGFLKQIFEYVVVDTGTVINDALLAVFDATDRLLVVSTPDIPSLKNASLFFELLELLKFPVSQTMFVLNRLVRGSAITAERVQDRLHHTVVGRIEDDPLSALSAVNAGEPLINADVTKAPAVRGLIDLVKAVEQDIAAEVEAQEAEATTGGRISKLFAS